MTTKTELNEALSTEGLIKTGIKKLALTVKAETIASVNKDAVIAEQAARIEQLVAENVAALNSVQVFADATEELTEIIGDEIGTDGVSKLLAAFDAAGSTPATDSVIREIQAKAVEALADWTDDWINQQGDMIENIREYAKQLRSGEVTL